MKYYILLLFKGINQKTGKIENSKKASKHEAVKIIRAKIHKNEEGHWTSDYLLEETQVSGLFSRFLNEYKFKSVKDNDVEKEEDINGNDEKDEVNVIDHEANQSGLNKAACNGITF